MTREFWDPAPEEQIVVLVDAATLRKAERLIESCEHCNPADAEIPFDNILDRVYRLRSQRDGYQSVRRFLRQGIGYYSLAVLPHNAGAKRRTAVRAVRASENARRLTMFAI